MPEPVICRGAGSAGAPRGRKRAWNQQLKRLASLNIINSVPYRQALSLFCLLSLSNHTLYILYK